MEPFETTPNAYSVIELTREIKELLETTMPPLWLRGEISNFVRHSSGHMYFSMKDQDAQIACVMWRNRNYQLFFTPRDGMEVLAYGSVRVYEKRGNYQFDISRLLPAGVGQLQLAFEQLKKKLFEQGLFDEAHKQALPAFPENIGIVTSRTGAAIHDMIQILHRRAPHVQILLRPTLVQGQGAAEDIAAAIEEFNAFGDVDVLIIGRGGGSLEDLWAFNEEVVARAIFASKIPVVSAVGHEIDYTISDFVADLRAPTPSAAAELVVHDRTELKDDILNISNRCLLSMRKQIQWHQQRLAALSGSYGLRRPADFVLQWRQRIDEIQHTLSFALQHTIQHHRVRLQQANQRLQDLAPDATLRRGYCMSWRAVDRQLVHRADEVKPSDHFVVQFLEGRIQAVAQVIHSMSRWNDETAPQEAVKDKN
ncbi:exodeoxyribonuclease VII large subunit [candidate division KSB1 bacterium]|nr:exodeoxyribonuclease VII large subunit [candidate division KSB1 bacterium]